MDHAPTSQESAFIRSIPGIANAEIATVRLTGTMLSKSIIDANDFIRLVLMQARVVDYATIGQGDKVQLGITVISREGLSERTASFYRPRTKLGDPRFWISGLSKTARPSDLLVIGTLREQVFAILVPAALFGEHASSRPSERLYARGDFSTYHRRSPAVREAAPDMYRTAVIREQAAGLLSRWHSVDNAFDRDVRALRAAMRDVAERGWIRAIGHGAPTVGETLEAALGIGRNNFRSPDFRGSIEIKSGRFGGSALQTLFSQIPAWAAPILGTKDLVLAHGTYSESKNRHEIYCTVRVARNSLQWSLAVRAETAEISVLHRGKDVLHYPMASLRSAFEAKHGATLFVKAQSRRIGNIEELKYEAATLRVRGRFPLYLAEIVAGNGGLDILANVTNGRARDHGYLWRVLKSRVPSLFAFEQELL